jgi:putative membrane protein
MNVILFASHHYHDGRWFPLFPLLFLGLWIAVVVTFVRRRRHWHHQSGESVLAERYARGEIDESEYRDRRAVLRSKG